MRAYIRLISGAIKFHGREWFVCIGIKYRRFTHHAVRLGRFNFRVCSEQEAIASRVQFAIKKPSAPLLGWLRREKDQMRWTRDERVRRINEKARIYDAAKLNRRFVRMILVKPLQRLHQNGREFLRHNAAAPDLFMPRQNISYRR